MKFIIINNFFIYFNIYISFNDILNYIEAKYDYVLSEESRIRRNPKHQVNRYKKII